MRRGLAATRPVASGSAKFAAIESGDTTGAAACWETHLSAADEYVTSGLGNRNVLDLLG